MSCSLCGADVEQGVYHTRPDNLAACPGEKSEPKAEPKADEKPARKSRSKK